MQTLEQMAAILEAISIIYHNQMHTQADIATECQGKCLCHLTVTVREAMYLYPSSLLGKSSSYGFWPEKLLKFLLKALFSYQSHAYLKAVYTGTIKL